MVHRRDDARELADLTPQSIHLSALMCPKHRLKVIEDVKAKLSANRERTGAAVRPPTQFG